MKKIVLLLFTLFLISCTSDEIKNYQKISKEDYYKLEAADTLLENSNFLITKFEDTIFKGNVQLLLRKKKTTGFDYYIFDPESYIENDSAIITYTPPFVSGEENGRFKKNGLWVYAKFYSGENKKGNSIYQTSESGVNFNVDSIPNPLKLASLPNLEGIYFYEKDSLIRASKEQSEDKFYELQKNGFYFIPNSGRFFKRVRLNSIK